MIHGLHSKTFLAGFFQLEADQSPIALGRAPEVKITVPHPSVSRKHAELVWEDDGYSVQDLKSANGTYMNGSTLREPHRLTAGDRIQIGPFSYVYQTYESFDVAQVAIMAEKRASGPLSGEAGIKAARIGRKFEGRELLGICHLISFRKQDGVLRVRGRTATGELEFRGGEIVRGELGELGGQEATKALLKQQSGHYKLKPSTSRTRPSPLFPRTASFLSNFQFELDRHLFGAMALDQTQHD